MYYLLYIYIFYPSLSPLDVLIYWTYRFISSDRIGSYSYWIRSFTSSGRIIASVLCCAGAVCGALSDLDFFEKPQVCIFGGQMAGQFKTKIYPMFRYLFVDRTRCISWKSGFVVLSDWFANPNFNLTWWELSSKWEKVSKGKMHFWHL